jgi:hypothetical protein
MTAQVIHLRPRKRFTTHQVDRPENGRASGQIDHVTVCPACKLHFDLDDLRQVFEHMHGRKPQIRLVE